MPEVMIRAGGMEVVMRGEVDILLAAQISRLVVMQAVAGGGCDMKCASCGRTDESPGRGVSWHWVSPDRCTNCVPMKDAEAQLPVALVTERKRRAAAKKPARKAVKRAAVASRVVEKDQVDLPKAIEPDATQADNILATLVLLGGKATTMQIRQRLLDEDIPLRDSEPGATLRYLQKKGRVRSLGREAGWQVVE